MRPVPMTERPECTPRPLRSIRLVQEETTGSVAGRIGARLPGFRKRRPTVKKKKKKRRLRSSLKADQSRRRSRGLRIAGVSRGIRGEANIEPGERTSRARRSEGRSVRGELGDFFGRPFLLRLHERPATTIHGSVIVRGSIEPREKSLGGREPLP